MILYLDNAATSFPKPRAVLQSVIKSINFCGNPGRSSHEIALESANQIYCCRNDICEYFGYGAPENIIFTLNTTYAINLAIHALYEKDSHVLISDLEHNAVYRPILQLSREHKICYDVFSHKENIVENIRKLKRKNTKLLVCAHASNVTGVILPIKEIGEFCKQNDIIFIIDAAQTAGHLPICLKDIYFDAFCAPAHKGLLGIQGCGFAILNGKKCKRDFITGGTGTQSFMPHMPSSLPDRYEAGTLPTPAICGLRAGIKYLCQETDKFLKIKNNTQYLYSELQNIGIKNLLSLPNETGIISFTCKDQEEFSNYLAEQHICIRSGFHCAPLAHQSLGTEKTGCIRTSLGLFTSKKDIDKFVSITNSFYKSRRV